jgi:hypothetical protein
MYWVDLINLTVVTHFVNNFFSSLTICNVLRTRKNALMTLHQIRDRKFAINSVFLNLECFILKTSILIVLIVGFYLNFESKSSYKATFAIAEILFTLECAISFLVNILVNSIFRMEFFKMINYQ